MGYAKRAVRTVRTLTAAEQKKVLDTIGEHRDGFRDFVIVSVVLGTGLRETELCALNVGDVADGPREIRRRVELRVFAYKGRKPSKGRKKAKATKPAKPKTQRIFLPRVVRRKLLKFLGWKKREGESLAPDAPLFCAGYSSPAKKGARLADRTVRYMWQSWQKRAGFKAPLFTFHELRHTFGTTLAARTKDPLYVQRALRHANLETTEIYMHVTDEQLAEALEDHPA